MKFIRPCIAILATIIQAACTPGAPPADPPKSQDRPSQTIKIVSALPRTGSATSQTTEIVNGIKLALEEARWLIGDFALAFEDIDFGSGRGFWDRAEVEDPAERIVKDVDVMVCIGTYDLLVAKTFMPILNRANLLMISPANTYPGLTKPEQGDQGEPDCYRPTGKINYVRVIPADDIQGTIGADWAKKSGVKRVFLLDDRESHGRVVANEFQRRCEEIGLNVVGHEGIDADAPQFRRLMTKIKSCDPDLVYFGGTTRTKAGQVAKDMAAVGLTCQFMVSDGCFEEAFIKAAGAENLNGHCFLTSSEFPTGKRKGKGESFFASYRRKFERDPERYAVFGYESALVALEAIRRAGTKDRDAIRAAAVKIRDFSGALGTWSFDENGDTTLRAMGIYTVRDGKFELIDSMP